ncbi:MAG: hypothetical protein ACRDMV_18100 [Streptosporangiales bacterium]
MPITSEPADFIDLETAQTYLHKEVNANPPTDTLAMIIAAAQNMIIRRVGQVSPVTAVDETCSFIGVVILDHRPVVSVDTVETRMGTVPEGSLVDGVDGWYLDGTEGVLRHTSRFPGPIRVTYQAGREPVPGNVTEAGLELVKHLWRGSQTAAGGGRPQFGDTADPYIPGLAHALPIRVRELLGLGSRDTDMPLVG